MRLFKNLLVKMATSTIITPKPTSTLRPFTVIVEGNIGSGKSEFLNYFKRYENICVLSEPVELWRNCRGHNLLASVYEDTNRWGFTFQSYVQLTMLQQHIMQTPQPIKLMERSIFSARYCFIENLIHNKIMPQPSASVLIEWFKWVITHQDVNVDLIVYLRTSPEVVHERIKLRNRMEEQSIPIDYLVQLHELHENWLYHKNVFTCPAPVITLNADLDKSVIIEEYEKYEPNILNKATQQA